MTDAMQKGKEPLRSFGDLMQLFTKDKEPAAKPVPAKSTPVQPPAVDPPAGNPPAANPPAAAEASSGNSPADNVDADSHSAATMESSRAPEQPVVAPEKTAAEEPAS